MNVLLLNGSPHARGGTYAALLTVAKALTEEGIAADIVHVGALPLRGCTACGYCKTHGRCVVEDEVVPLSERLARADGLVLGSPVYYASPNGNFLGLLDRLFHSAVCDLRMKVGAAVVCGRRGGLSAAFDVLNKYFFISGMPVASGQYWNSLHGASEKDTLQDAEGLQSMRTLGRHMAFLLKSISLGKDAFGLPEKEPPVRTGFIR